MNDDGLNLDKLNLALQNSELQHENEMLKIENNALKAKDKNNLVTLEMYKKLMEENIELREKLDEYEYDDNNDYLDDDDINDDINDNESTEDKNWELALSLYEILKRLPNFAELTKDLLSKDDIQKLEYDSNLRNFRRYLTTPFFSVEVVTQQKASNFPTFKK